MKNRIVKGLFLSSLFRISFFLFLLFSLTVCAGTKTSVNEKTITETPSADDNPIAGNVFNWDDIGPVNSKQGDGDLSIYWQPLTRDMTYLEKVMDTARDYQVSGLCLSDEQWPLDKQEKDSFCRQEIWHSLLVKAQGAEQEIWYELQEAVPEFEPSGLSQAAMASHQVGLKEEFRQKYSRLLKDLLPGLKGIILNISAPLVSVGRENQEVHAETLAPASVQTLVSLVRNGVLPEQGIVAIRPPAIWNPAISGEIVEQFNFPSDLIIFNRNAVEFGQSYCLPLNPALDFFTKNQQWVEFDLGLENQGENVLPYADPQLYLQQLRTLKEQGIHTVCLRLDQGMGQKGKNALNTPWGQLNLSVFSAFKQNSQVTSEEIIKNWEKKQFPGAYKILQLTTAMVRRAFFPKKLCYAYKSTLPDYEYLTSTFTGGVNIHAADGTDTCANPLDRALALNPTLAWLKEIQTEDLINLNDLQSMEITLGEKHVNIYVYSAWKEGLRALKIYIDLFRLHKQAYFAIRLYHNNPTAISREQVGAYIREFENMVNYFSPLPESARVRDNTPLTKIAFSLKHGLECCP